MATKPVSSLAAVIALHGGPSKQEIQIVCESLHEASIDSETFNWGPARAMAEKRLLVARKIMAAFLRKL